MKIINNMVEKKDQENQSIKIIKDTVGDKIHKSKEEMSTCPCCGSTHVQLNTDIGYVRDSHSQYLYIEAKCDNCSSTYESDPIFYYINNNYPEFKYNSDKKQFELTEYANEPKKGIILFGVLITIIVLALLFLVRISINTLNNPNTYTDILSDLIGKFAICGVLLMIFGFVCLFVFSTYWSFNEYNKNFIKINNKFLKEHKDDPIYISLYEKDENFIFAFTAYCRTINLLKL